MAGTEIPGGLQDELRGAWHRYIDLTAALRPALHAYCRRLTGNLWDAEDLVQDTLLRGFGTLGQVHHEIASPRAYLLRTATNLWIDAVRRRGSEASALAARAIEPEAGAPPDGAVRDVGAILLQRLAPQERAAVVLKELFDASLDEIALVLATTPGAIKSALHRGREKMREASAPKIGTDGDTELASEKRAEGDRSQGRRRAPPSAELVDRFVELYAARDKAGLVALMLDGGQVENVGCSMEFGRDQFPDERGWFQAAVFGHPEWPTEFQYENARMERGIFEGEPLLLGFTTRRGKEALEQVLRIEEHDGGIARLRGYAFCPETMRAVGEALGLRVRTGLYRYPTPAPGEHW